MKKIYILSLALAISLNSSYINAKTIPISEVKCMAETIYWEARGETYEGRISIAGVVLNRVASDKFPDTICQVVYQKNPLQFAKAITHRHKIKDRDSWANSLELADSILSGNIKVPTKFKALYFDGKLVKKPKNLILHATIGNHKFYI